MPDHAMPDPVPRAHTLTGGCLCGGVRLCHPARTFRRSEPASRSRGQRHGQWREPSSIVLGSVRYARIASEGAAQALVNSLSYDNALVLVGFGAPLDAVQFEPLRSWLTTSPGALHYRLVTTAERGAFSSPAYVEEQRHLQLVDYGSHYEDLAPFLRSLRPRTEMGSDSHHLDRESGQQQEPVSSLAVAPRAGRSWWPDDPTLRIAIITFVVALLAAVPSYLGLFTGQRTSFHPVIEWLDTAAVFATG